MAISKINTPEIFDLGATNTSLKLPSGDTASRPTSPSTGQWRYNTDLKYVEYYDGSNWQQIGIEEECTTDTVNFPSGATLAAYYKLDYSPRDESTNNYDGTQVDVSYKNGSPYSQAAVFNGSSSYINLPLNIASIFFGKNTLAVSFWFKTTTTARQRMFSDYAQNSRNIDITMDGAAGGTVEVVTMYSSSSITFDSTASYNDGNWHHIVVALDQSSLTRTIYIDNVLLNTATFSSNSWNGTAGARVTLGGFYSSSGGYNSSFFFDGQIDQLRVFTSAITNTQVSELYNEVQCPCTTNTIGYPIDSIGSTSNTNTQAYYKLDGNPFDATANANNGTWVANENYSVSPYGTGIRYTASTSSTITTPIESTDLATNFSVSFWIKLDALSFQAFNGLYSKSPISNQGWIFGIRDVGGSTFRFFWLWYYNTSQDQNFVDANNVDVAVDTFYHVALSFTNGSLPILYVNGVASNTYDNSTTTPPVYNAGAVFQIGSTPNTNLGAGVTDQVRIFSTALSASQVSALSNEVYCNTISTLDVFGDSSGVALYQFNNSAASTDSSTNNGTWYGTEAYVGGYFGSAASFDGNSSYVRTPLDFDSAALDNYTISLWIKVAASPASNTVFAGTIDSAAKNGIYLSINTTDTIRFFERDNNGTVTTLESTDTINIGEWNHIVAVRQYGTNFLYINNGTAVSASNDSTFSHAIDFTIGRSGDYSTSELNGEIDQVRILRKGVSAFEVTQLFSE